MSAVLLLSGGLDSSSVAAWKRPARCLFVDYGQRAATAERRASSMVCELLDLPISEIRIDCSSLGRGTLSGAAPSIGSVWEEFWPFRNQLLVTFAAAWALEARLDEVWCGSIQTDNRHVDGSADFFRVASDLVAMQEGQIRVSAPAIDLTCHDLVQVSGIDDRTLSWTYSCHTGVSACNTCAGCEKRAGALAYMGRLQPNDLG